MRAGEIAFGLMSGLYTTVGLLPHLFSLGLLGMMRSSSSSSPPILIAIIGFTIGARFLSEKLFWNRYKERVVGAEEVFKNWRRVIGQSFFSHSGVWTSLLIFLMDIAIEVILIHQALKLSLSPVVIFLALLGCQAIFAPIQGFVSDCFSQEKSILFAAIMGTLAVVVSREIPLDGKVQTASTFSFISLFGLSSFGASAQMLFVLCGKGLLANLTVIARAAIAEVIAVETANS